MSKNTIIITIVSVVLVLGLLAMVYSATNAPAPSVELPEKHKTLQANEHIKWSPAKKNVLIEYADLQCPACKGFHDAIKSQIETTDIPKKVTFVYRHFPLYQAHPQAQRAAYAAEAAGKQGKFFEMVDVLFANQATWAKEGNPTNSFVGYAKDLKLNEEQFEKDMNSSDVKDKVAKDAASGNEAGVNATPTFFYNGVKVQVNSFEEMKQLLNTAK